MVLVGCHLLAALILHLPHIDVKKGTCLSTRSCNERVAGGPSFRPKKVLKDCAIQPGSLLFPTFQVSVPLDLQGKDQYGSIVNSFLSSSPYVLHFDSQCTFFRCFSSYQDWSTLSKLCFVVSSAWERGSTIHIPILINCNPDKEWSIVP